MSRKTSGTAWIIPEKALQMFRATCCDDGNFVMARGAMPRFDPSKARYATSDMVTNICANAGITIRGDVASARRFTGETHVWKQTMSLEELKAHKYLGQTMPSVEVIKAAYANFEEIEA